MLKKAANKIWLQPDWPAPAKVGSICTTRLGGVSQPPWNSFNLASHVADAAESVRQNRLILRKFIQASPIFLEQVHGTSVAILDGLEPSDQLNWVADASCTTRPGLACCVMVADCLPVLFTDHYGDVVAAAHVGWRGLLGQNGRGILDTTVAHVLQLLARQNRHEFDPKMSQALQETALNSLMAWLGPCIGTSAFEVGQEVVAAFIKADPKNSAFFIPKNGVKWLANLAGLARHRLAQLGVRKIYGNDASADWCTVANSEQFFSYRHANAQAQVTGRFAACIWLQR